MQPRSFPTLAKGRWQIVDLRIKDNELHTMFAVWSSLHETHFTTDRLWEVIHASPLLVIARTRPDTNPCFFIHESLVDKLRDE